MNPHTQLPVPNSLTRYFTQVHAHEAELREQNRTNFVPIISIEHPDMPEHRPGVVMEAMIPIAAQMLTKRTHRVATKEEYEAYKQDLAARTDELRRLELEKKGVTTHVTPVAVGRPAKSGAPDNPHK